MYAILISAALAIYSIILVDFSLLYKEIAVNNDLLTSTQALYTAEGAIESTVGLIGKNDITVSNIEFQRKAETMQKVSEHFLEYNEGADSLYIEKNLTLDAPSLDSAEGTHANNRVTETYSKFYLADGQALDQKAFYGLEPRKSKGFVIREVDSESNFNEVVFEFNQGTDDSELLFDIFTLPKEDEGITFQDFEALRDDPTNNPIKRLSINTRDSYNLGRAFGNGTSVPLTVTPGSGAGPYKKTLTISGFQPMLYNYILYFQTLDNEPTHYKLTAYRGAQQMVLPNMMQTIDVIGVTPTGLYSRVKYQRQSEEGLAPGLNFVHFTRQNLIK